MSATSEEDAVYKYLMLLFYRRVLKDEKLRIYCENLWEKRNEWANFARQKISLKVSDSTNYVAVIFRIMKDHILNKLSTFNFPQKVNYILTKFEKYMQKWLIEFCNGNYPKAFFISVLPKVLNAVALNVMKVEEFYGLFKVLNNLSNEEYVVDVVNGTCSCRDGQTGKLCSHALEVIMNLDDEIQNCFDSVTNETKHKLFYVATGSAQPNDLCSQLRYSLVSTEILNSCAIDESSSDYRDNAFDDENISDFNSESVFSSDTSEYELTSQEYLDFESLCNRIKKGIHTSPETYVPAVKKMLRNAKQFANTDADLISAMHNFATYESEAAQCKVGDMGRCFSTKIVHLGKRKPSCTVQPTVVSIQANKGDNAIMAIKI
ncbi:hypothetical protein TNCT_723401 [Trichonephila clavata]|uniref:SWIM-type domain-containing protein n=1 Tax=Trichonephila clavata TaxID=2740835 RepID=A0A8X6HRT5_TRICU|nr:hypothetical protein TNCT_723401 [Trichonephila clavata]